MTSLRVDEQSAARREAMPEKLATPRLTGIMGDKAEEAGESRSGEDTRRRGWYWNWNTMVTQFAPLIGLDGKGLLDSYIVWTDRRDDSPFRGYAFPSTTAEANFYGIDRNVLGTINKILVALDLIEIKKSMVHRPDEAGNDWKFPHNTYRVKDHGDNFQLSADAVRRVVQLAVDDTAVYRRIKHIFGSKFKPIDPNSVWYEIIAELESTPNWQKLQAKSLADEKRTSERSRKGHAARRKTDEAETPVITPKPAATRLEAVPAQAQVSTASTVDNDSVSDSTVASESPAKSTAAPTSNGLETSAAQSSNASGVQSSSDAAPTSTGSPTIAQDTSTTNYDLQTTTTTGDKEAQKPEKSANVHQPGLLQDFGGGPDDSRDRELTFQLFDEANEKPVSIAARRLLSKIATDFADLAQSVSLTGWALVGAGIEEAVSSGSSYVASKRVREILNRWNKDGVPEIYAPKVMRRDAPSRNAVTAVTGRGDGSHSFVRTPEREPSAVEQPDPVPAAPTPSIEKAAASESSLWDRALDLLAADKAVPAAIVQRLRGEAEFDRLDGDQAIVRAPAELIALLTQPLQRSLQAKLSVAARKPVYLRLESGANKPAAAVAPFHKAEPVVVQGKVFGVPGSGMTNAQLWAAVQASLNGAGDIPRTELSMWSTSSELLAAIDDTLVLGFTSRFLCRRAEHRREDLEREFSHFVGYTCQLEIVEIDVWRSAQSIRGA